MSAHPEVVAWPVCEEPECETPYVLRRCLAMNGNEWKMEWLWQRDCKHKKAGARVVTKEEAEAET